MPRVSRGPHLYLKRRPGGRALWYVRDGKSRFSTGCEQSDHRGARDALAAYLARAIGAPKFGDGDPDRVTVSDPLVPNEVAPRQDIEFPRLTDAHGARTFRIGSRVGAPFEHRARCTGERR